MTFMREQELTHYVLVLFLDLLVPLVEQRPLLEEENIIYLLRQIPHLFLKILKLHLAPKRSLT
jgi:hypothetical protein